MIEGNRGAAEKAPVFVTLGRRRYRAERPWGRLGDGLSFAGISTVTVGPSGRVYVLRRQAPRILVLSAEGDLVDAWEMPDLTYPHGIRAAGDGRLLVTDLDGHRVFVLGEDGSCQLVLGDRERPRFGAPFNHPTDSAMAPDGAIYVADGYGNSCVHAFTAAGQHERSWGTPGTGPAEFSTPHSVLLDASGRVLVVDRENGRVQIFDRSGDFRGEIGGLHKPMAIAALPDGTLLVTDQTPRLSAFSPEGTLVGRCRTFGTVGHGVAAAPTGEIFVAEMAPDNLTRLVPAE